MPFIACLTNTTRQQLLQRLASTLHTDPAPPTTGSSDRARPTRIHVTRCSRPLCRSQTTNPPTPTPTNQRDGTKEAQKTQLRPPRHTWAGLIPQDPTVCQPHPTSTAPGSTPTPPASTRPGSTESTTTHHGQSFIDDSTSEHHHASHTVGGWTSGHVLLRKEVIQPHLPVRLPCYDFVPIASPTFDGSLPQGLGHRLRVLPTFVT